MRTKSILAIFSAILCMGMASAQVTLTARRATLYRLIAKKKMKRLVLMMIPAMICGVMLTSCDKQEGEQVVENVFWEILDDGGLVLKASNVETNNNNVATVNFVEGDIVASADFINGGFELILPSTLPDEHLSWRYAEGCIGIQVRDYFWFRDIYAHNRAGKYGGSFMLWLVDEKNEMFGLVSFVYAKNSFSIIDSCISTTISDLHYIKGWNIQYYYSYPTSNSNTYKSTTQRPENVKLVWVYYPPHSGPI